MSLKTICNLTDINLKNSNHIYKKYRSLTINAIIKQYKFFLKFHKKKVVYSINLSELNVYNKNNRHPIKYFNEIQNLIRRESKLFYHKYFIPLD